MGTTLSEKEERREKKGRGEKRIKEKREDCFDEKITEERKEKRGEKRGKKENQKYITSPDKKLQVSFATATIKSITVQGDAKISMQLKERRTIEKEEE